MFLHNFVYSLKILLKNKILIFWTFAFPLILGSFFFMSFSNIASSEKLDIFNIAIVNNDYFNNNNSFKETFKILGDDNNKQKLFNINYVSLDEASKLLEKKDIVGYIAINEKDYNVIVENNGIHSTILKYITDNVIQNSDIFNNLVADKIINLKNNNEIIDYEKIYKEVGKTIITNYVNVKDVSNGHLDYMMIPFYTLIAMTCLYGGVLGLVIVNQILPNMSSTGKRISVTPTNKFKLLISGLLASYLIQLIGILLLFLYTCFVLKINYGNNLFNVILLAILGCFAGLSLGVGTSVMIKANENLKTGFIISFTMLGCFLAGMMAIDIKYYIDQKFPFINMINPANMITDGFYSLYYYNGLDRYYISIFSLITFSLILIFLSFLSLRRQKYDSI